jgi:hypothetical protein
MYTINFRFRKKIYRLLNSRNNAAYVRLLVLVIVFTFIFTSYLYGLIEISSKKLVIKIAGSNDLMPDKNSNIYDDSAVYDNEHDDKRRKIFVNLKQPNQRSKLNNENTYNKRRFLDKPPASSVDYSTNENITKMFIKIERFNSMIKSQLSSSDIDIVKKQREKYEEALREKNLKKAHETKVNRDADANDDEDDDDEDDERLFDTFASNELVTRALIIKCIKYEKILAQRKAQANSVKTVKELLVEYSEKNKIDME